MLIPSDLKNDVIYSYCARCTQEAFLTYGSAVQGTQTEHKNELLYSSFGINYASLPARFRKVRHPFVVVMFPCTALYNWERRRGSRSPAHVNSCSHPPRVHMSVPIVPGSKCPLERDWFLRA